MSKKRTLIQGLPVSATTVDLLIRVNKQAHIVIQRLHAAALEDNVFGKKMAMTAAMPDIQEYVKLGQELEEMYRLWSAKTNSVPVEASKLLKSARRIHPKEEVIDVEYNDLE